MTPAPKPVDQLVRESLEALTVTIERGGQMEPATLKLLLATLQAMAPLAESKRAEHARLAEMRRRRGNLISADDARREEQAARARLQELRVKFPKLSKSKAKTLIARELGVKVGRITRYLATES